jgi:isoleucyl-tRNA synthetase
VELVHAGTDLVSLEARPSFRALGKRFGKATPAAAEAIRQLSSEAVARFESGEPVEIVVEGTAARPEPGDLVVHRQARGDVVVRADGVVVAAIDPALSDDLRQEGVAREIVSRVQRLRRDAGYRLSDRIDLWIAGDAALVEAARRHAAAIAGETLVRTVAWDAPPTDADLALTAEIDGMEARLAVRRAGG